MHVSSEDSQTIEAERRAPDGGFLVVTTAVAASFSRWAGVGFNSSMPVAKIGAGKDQDECRAFFVFPEGNANRTT
jgi:hypothetical protein